MRLKGISSAIGCGLLVLFGTMAHAQTIGYTLTLSANAQFGFNATDFTLLNTSTSATITNITMTMGDLRYNFDYAAEQTYTVGSGTFTLITPDTGDGGVRDTRIEMTTGGFEPTEQFRFSGDIDLTGSGDTIEDARTILFNNGDAANSTFRVTFSDGNALQLTFPDGEVNAPTYTFSQSAVVPAPNSLMVGMMGLSGIGWHLVRRRRKPL